MAKAANTCKSNGRTQACVRRRIDEDELAELQKIEKLELHDVLGTLLGIF